MLVPPPIQGLGASNGFQMQVELTDGSYDFERLQRVTDEIVAGANRLPEIQGAFTAFRASVPQVTVKVDKTQTATLNVNVGDVYNTVQIYLGSSFVNLFTRFGHNYMVYLQADPLRRVTSDDVKNLYVRSQSGSMVPVGAVAEIRPALGTSVVSLYNLFPAATINGTPARGFSSGQSLDAMEALAKKTLPRGMSFEWTAMSYQEKLVGSSVYFIFALAILLVYFVLAGQYESWITPAAVILAVPMALLGTVAALLAVGLSNNIYVQIGLVLLIALSAKNAILIVEMAREGRAAGKDILGGDGPRLAGALPADPDDVVHVHPGSAAARHRERRRRRGPPVARHRGRDGHARVDVPRGAVRAVALRRSCSGGSSGRSP